MTENHVFIIVLAIIGLAFMLLILALQSRTPAKAKIAIGQAFFITLSLNPAQ